MSQLDKDAKILTDKKVEGTPSTEGKVLSNRTVGSQGLKKFNLNKFNSGIKKKIAPEVIQPVVQDSIETSEPQVVQVIAEESEQIMLVNVVTQPAPILTPIIPRVKTTSVLEAAQVVAKTHASEDRNTQVMKTALEKEPVKAAPVSESKPIIKAEEVLIAPKLHVNTSVSPRNDTTNTTATKQNNHVKSTSSTRDNHSNDHVKIHVSNVVQVGDDSILLNIQSLSKYQRVIMNYMFRKCSQTGTNKTSHIYTNELLLETGIKVRTFEDSLARLLEGKIINIDHVKMGRNGFRIFTINPVVFSQLMQESQENKHHVNLHVEHHGFLPSKEVSKFNNNITNYTQTPNVVLNKNFNFKDLDFTEVAPLHPMQVNSSIRKLAEEKLEKEEMQLFVDKFMVWVSTQKNVQSVIGLFVAKIKEYIEEGDSPVMQCLSKKEHLAEAEFKLKADQLQRQTQMTEKYLNEVASIALDERYNVWISSLSSEDKLNYVPESNLAKLGSAAHSGALKAYFIENFNNNP